MIEEKQGSGGGHFLLKDEQVQVAVRVHLLIRPTGKVTPREFCHTLNEQILPLLGFALKDRLSECMAQQWLVLLGWRHMGVKQGVYMDSHERLSVVEYWNNVFLPLMASFE